MPPSKDPYANPRAKLFDFLLCLLIVVLIVLMILTAPKHHHAQRNIEAGERTSELASK